MRDALQFGNQNRQRKTNVAHHSMRSERTRMRLKCRRTNQSTFLFESKKKSTNKQLIDNSCGRLSPAVTIVAHLLVGVPPVIDDFRLLRARLVRCLGTPLRRQQTRAVSPRKQMPTASTYQDVPHSTGLTIGVGRASREQVQSRGAAHCAGAGGAGAGGETH